ncbi:MAG: PIN domain nuclease [Thermoproteus sp. AZ2]|jgi:UPF0271 protein|uniref:PIN domain nuclease n=1 Tax=Thermoproteus sp. AZ2 TaxID=1609232 RepID=A0ACC6V0Y4_9CREN
MSCYVLDASAFIHGRDLRLFGGRLLTTTLVAEELKDPRAQAALEVLGVEVREVDEGEIAKLLKKFPGLSRADASALLLALKERCVLLTDDAALAKAARRLGVEAKGFYFIR